MGLACLSLFLSTDMTRVVDTPLTNVIMKCLLFWGSCLFSHVAIIVGDENVAKALTNPFNRKEPREFSMTVRSGINGFFETAWIPTLGLYWTEKNKQTKKHRSASTRHVTFWTKDTCHAKSRNVSLGQANQVGMSSRSRVTCQRLMDMRKWPLFVSPGQSNYLFILSLSDGECNLQCK